MVVAVLLAALAGCAWIEANTVARGSYGSASGARGEIGLRF